MFSVAQCKVLNQPIFLDELLKAINALKPAKALGLDGFTPEFYNIFKNVLPPKLHKLFTSIFAQMLMPPSWWEASVVLLSKEGKDLSLQQFY